MNEAGDCDDSRASVGPAGPELATSGRDDDCDGRGTITAVSDLPSRTLWPREGESYNQIGPAALIAMDWSADDVPDLLIANAGIVSTDGTHAGGALSVFRGPLSRDTATLYANEADTLLWGVQYDDFFQAAHLGDLDGDGYPDLLVGGGDSASESHLYVLRGPLPSGEAELSDVAQVLAAGAATSLITGDRAGDPDGDGLPGVAVVDRKADADRGEVYLFHTLGPAEQVADADTTFTTRSLYDIGTPLSPGDLDGDGVDDLVLSGDGETAFVLLADALASVGAVTVEDVGLQILRNEEHPETFYHPMQPMAVGDVNEDGQDDLAISDVWGGYVFVLDGPFGASPTVDTATDWSRVFVSDNGGVSYPEIDALARLGDWDLDGHDDLAIGNRWFVAEELRDGWMEGTPPDGAVFLVAGPVPVGVIDLERGSADRITAGYHGSGGFGGALASDGGDIDGDGAPDLVIADDPYAMYILFGGGTI